MIIKNLKNGLWKFEINGIVLVGTYNECLERLEVYAKMWGI